jgi:hypothetical protein
MGKPILKQLPSARVSWVWPQTEKEVLEAHLRQHRSGSCPAFAEYEPTGRVWQQQDYGRPNGHSGEDEQRYPDAEADIASSFAASQYRRHVERDERCTTFSGPITVLAPRRLPAEAGPRACAVTTVTTTEAPETATAPIVVEFPTAWRSLSSRRPWAKLGLIRSRMMATRKPQLPRRARFRAPVDHRPVRAPGPVRRQSRPIRCRRPGRPKLAPRPRPRIEACPANIRAAWRAPRSIDGALSASRTARTPTVMATRGVRSNRAPNVARACSRAASPVFGKAQLRPEIGARQGDNKEENGVGNSERAKCRRLTGSGPP